MLKDVVTFFVAFGMGKYNSFAALNEKVIDALHIHKVYSGYTREEMLSVLLTLDDRTYGNWTIRVEDGITWIE